MTMRCALHWLFGYVLLVTVGRSELTLVSERDGQVVRIERLGAGRLVGKSPDGAVTVPLSAPLRVEGDLAAETTFVYWPAQWFLHRPPGRDSVSESERPWFSYTRLVSGSGWKSALFEEIWPRGVGDAALAVFGWVVDGRIVRVHAVPIPSKSGRTAFRVDHLFRLSLEDARGRPVVMIWSEGRFVAPKPLFKEAPLAEAASAVLLHDQKRLRAALDRKVRLNGLSTDGRTLLDLATSSGNIEAVDLLLARGVKADPVLSAAPLNLAACFGRLETVRRLLDANANPNRRYGDAVPLQQALRAGHENVARLLIERGAKLEYASSLVEKPLRQAIDGGYADLARLMWSKGAKEPVEDEDRARILWEQVKRGHTRMVELLLERKWNPEAVRDGRSALWMAVRTRNRALVEALVRAGAKAEIADGSGTTALMLAAAAADLDVVRLLLHAGALPATKRRDGNTALHFAAAHRLPALLEAIVANDTDLQAAGAGGVRPLEAALFSGAAETAHWLSERGARCDLDAASAPVVLEKAIALDLAPVLADALARGWPVDARVAGRDMLRFAQLTRATQCERLLVQAGATGAALPAPWCAATALDRMPEALRAPAPMDLREPENRWASDTVEVELEVDEGGEVFAARVRGRPDPRAAFAALRAARAWQLAPPTRAGDPVRTTLVHAFVFPSTPDIVLDDATVDVPPQPITRWLAAVLPWNPNSGEVIVRCAVTQDGAAEDVHVVKAPDAEHARSAFQAIPNWSFTPALKNGLPVRVRTEVFVPVTF